MRRSQRLSRIAIGLSLLCCVVLWSCSRQHPEDRIQTPTASRLAAKPSGVGVPYDRYIVVRHQDRLVALNLHATSQLGDRVRYEWFGGSDGTFGPQSDLEHGSGEAVERPHATGRIAVPGMPTLEWSRGSDATGWIYWPERYAELEVYSIAFGDLAEIDTRSGDGRWLRRGEPDG